MAIKIIGLIIGALVLGAGIYYLAKERRDPESRKIYAIVSAVGGVIAVMCACCCSEQQAQKAVFCTRSQAGQDAASC